MKKFFLICLILIFFLSSCSVYHTLTNVQRLQFKLGSVNGFTIAGVNISNISSLTDISALDIIKLTNAFASGKFPTNFTLNLIAKNPNDGTGGTTQTTAIIKNLDWRLLIDNNETINGAIQNIEVPGVGKETVIPIQISLDLLKFLNKSYDDLMKLALAIGGKNGSAARLTLKVKPTVDTFLGPITYPGEISVIDREFRSE
ncbi:MAG: hypothetical protein N2490_03495 [Ignavibacteria bacterium]|nr:hypothetical protein [Ignavibacteria bacterium]